MEANQYVKAYPSTLSAASIHSGEHSDYIADAQDWSYAFGRQLYADLAGTPTETERHPVNDREYWKWTQNIHEKELSLISDEEEGMEARLHALNEINFHMLNSCMRGGWLPIHEGGWPSKGDRLHRLGATERSLALSGFIYFAVRQKSDPSALFEGKLKDIHPVISGKIQEFDAALVLMGVVRRHPNLSVVPAPLNFERTRKQTNVDFVMVDCVERRAIGVQVKTQVRAQDYKDSDKDRVVFVDGTVDFDNIRAMRTRRNSSVERVVPWPGIIAAKMVDTMKPQKNGVRLNTFMKGLAHTMVGNTKVEYSKVVDRVEERILNKL